MATIVTRQTRPEAILVVIFLIVALYMLLTGRRGLKKKTSKTRAEGSAGDATSSDVDNRDDGDDAASPARRERERKRDKEEEDRRKRKKAEQASRRDETGTSDTNTSAVTTPTSTDDVDNEEAKNAKKERERKRQKEKEKEKRRKEKEEKKKKEEEEKAKKDKKAKATPDDDDSPQLPSMPDRPKPEGELWKSPAPPSSASSSRPTTPVLLERNADGTWKRPPTPKDGVKFDDGGKRGKENKNYNVYSIYDTPVTMYNQDGLEHAKNHESRSKGGDDDILYGKLDGSESPLKGLKETGKLSQKLLSFMEKAEYLASQDLLLNQTLGSDIKAMALKDQWLDGAGPIPEIIGETIRQLLLEKHMDVTKCLEERSCVNPKTSEAGAKVGKANAQLNEFAGFLINAGYNVDDLREDLKLYKWKEMTSEQIRELVRTWVDEQIKKGRGMSLVASFFLPYYRATVSYKRAHIGKGVPPKWEEHLDSLSRQLIDWFRYIGKAFLVSRMFSSIGADLGDGNIRVSISPRRSVVGFTMDFTIFTPEPTADELEKRKKLTRMLAKSNAEAPILRVKYLALRWADHLNEDVYPQPDGRKLFSESNPFHITRVTFRPGLERATVNSAALKLATSGASTPRLPPNAPPKRDWKIMPVSSQAMAEEYEQHKATGLTEGFARTFRAMNAVFVRFVNKRQYHWYKSSDGKLGDMIDESTFSILLMLCSTGLFKYHLQQKFKVKGSKEYTDDDGAAMDFEYDAKYGVAQTIDLGGMVPLENATTTQPQILPLNDFRGLRGILLPLLLRSRHNSRSFPASSSLVINEKWGLFKWLCGPRAITVTFHARDTSEKENLVREILEAMREEMKGWALEATSGGSSDSEAKGALRQRIDEAIGVIRWRVKFIVLGDKEQYPVDEKDVEAEGLKDFDVPEEYLPSLLR
ncbi:hypothetical protein I350_00179 [Cryptococcus amylolentus CBS 6273]|uniref:Uncharacterized protein n=1 Tax=Cryptococcus amylolentus CBS 6273 TaxID=1296118 RepID=A0A1E3KE83_9TREE|nr:hypothetical protein I350_00179 [Cryptococcus amylolentus CBS 6273]